VLGLWAAVQGMCARGMVRARYDLEDRLVEFAVRVTQLAEGIVSSFTGKHAGTQLLRCSTSPLANYAEARSAESQRDFVHKMRICLKELRETRAWLKFIRLAQLDPCEGVEAECDELIAIFVASIRTANKSTR